MEGQAEAASLQGTKVAETLERLAVVAEAQAETSRQLLELQVSPASPGGRTSKEEDDDRYIDKVNALSGLEFKQKPPVIKDNDKNLNKHRMEFQSLLDMHAFGRKAVRALDKLHVYRKTLEPGGIRLAIYDHEMRVAMRNGRLPAEAKTVFDEVIAKQRRRIRETDMEKEERVEKAFQNLEMGRQSHAQFRGSFEDRLED